MKAGVIALEKGESEERVTQDAGVAGILPCEVRWHHQPGRWRARLLFSLRLARLKQNPAALELFSLGRPEDPRLARVRVIVFCGRVGSYRRCRCSESSPHSRC
jgi:hypothetical protein